MISTPFEPLQHSFYARDTKRVARALLGCYLRSDVGKEVTIGRIVEVQAYVGPHDPAAHGYGNKRTRRNERLFGPPATSYVYFIYGMHWCFNAVTEKEEYPAAVLIRALEPIAGIATMCERRNAKDRRLLCSGPARLCQALGIDGSVNGKSVIDGPVQIVRPRVPQKVPIQAGSRIGISKASSWPLRFTERGSSWLSRG
jgi:DNA-3-methyladenine glycosylase